MFVQQGTEAPAVCPLRIPPPGYLSASSCCSEPPTEELCSKSGSTSPAAPRASERVSEHGGLSGERENGPKVGAFSHRKKNKKRTPNYGQRVGCGWLWL